MVRYFSDRILTQADFDRFAQISGDTNPIHIDPEFSARTRFGRTVSHGMLLYTVIWGLVQKHYPGARQISQDLMFPSPAYADERLRFEISELETSSGEKTLSAKVTRAADSALVLDGQTTIAMP